MTPDSTYKLCYVGGNCAWFTTSLSDQWGDDWNDAPYEHNAGAPYAWYDGRGCPQYHLFRVMFEGPFETPADIAGGNSRYSVQDINHGAVAWLTSERWCEHRVSIPAGTAYPDFLRLVGEAGGMVYVPAWDR